MMPSRLPPEPCGKCLAPSCLQCFPFERPRNVHHISSMLDVSMGEADKAELDVAIRDKEIGEETMTARLDRKVKEAAVRKKNIDESVLAPTLEDIRPDTLGEALGKAGFPVEGELHPVLDFTGEVDGGGIKMSMYDDFITKPPLELVPMALTRGCARALGHGAKKYAPNNWRRGMRWGEVFGALKRHLDAWNEGEDIDAQEDGGSGLNHLDHAAACLAFLCHMVGDERYKKMDDRP